MVIDAIGEIVIYALTVAQGVSVGLILALTAGSTHRSALYGAGLLGVGVTVLAGFVLGASAPWIGPIFAVVASVTAVVVAAHTLADDPAMEGAPFGQRIVFALSRRPRSTELEENAN